MRRLPPLPYILLYINAAIHSKGQEFISVSDSDNFSVQKWNLLFVQNHRPSAVDHTMRNIRIRISVLYNAYRPMYSTHGDASFPVHCWLDSLNSYFPFFVPKFHLFLYPLLASFNLTTPSAVLQQQKEVAQAQIFALSAFESFLPRCLPGSLPFWSGLCVECRHFPSCLGFPIMRRM